MHDMSNTRKEIAARLGFAAGNGAKAKFGRFDTELKFLDFQIMQQPDLAQKNVIVLAEKMGAMSNITKDEMDGLMRAAKWLKMESQVKSAYESARSRMSRLGTKTRMTREQTEEQKAGLKIMSAADPAVGAKIAKLIKEGKPQDQAVAIALDMKRRGEL